MTREELFHEIKQKKSYLCIGLDTDAGRIPSFLKEGDDPVFDFNRAIIEATHDLCVAYKPNLAFYESRGAEGWQSLEKTVRHIRACHPRLFIIADAKRGDIGNTSLLYAKAFFDRLGADALTVSPYMGSDSVQPFLRAPGRWVVILALTSNPGAADFQLATLSGGPALFERVLEKAKSWGTEDNLMFVAGATQAGNLDTIRRIIPGHFLLVPGVGAQGGSLGEVSRHGMNDHCGLLVNVSRTVLYASPGKDFAAAARNEARRLQQEMQQLLREARLL